jgi:hypothetical protein
MTSSSPPGGSGTRRRRACFKLSTPIGRLSSQGRRIWTERRRGVTPRGRISSQTRRVRKCGARRVAPRGAAMASPDAVMIPSAAVMIPSGAVMTRSRRLAIPNGSLLRQWHTLQELLAHVDLASIGSCGHLVEQSHFLPSGSAFLSPRNLHALSLT